MYDFKMSNRIYIETSIPSFYFTERNSPDAIARKKMINYELGLPTPILTTPMNYLTGGNDD
jgi:hypothetical protein